MNKQSLPHNNSSLFTSFVIFHLSKFHDLIKHIPKKSVVVLLALCVMVLNSGCTSTASINSNEGQDSPLKQPKSSDQKLSQLNIAMSPSQNSDEQRKKRQLLADYLQEKLGIPVNIEIPQEYDIAIDLIAEGKVQIAYLGPFSYVKARQRNSQLEPLVAYIDKRTGRPWYTSSIVVDTQRGIQTLQDLKGKRVGFVNQSSTSGYLVPAAHLTSQQINFDQDFASIHYAGSHNKNVLALESGQVDAIGINKPTFLKAQQSGKLPLEKYQMIWESDPIPNAPIVVSRQVPASLKKNLQKAFINAPRDLAALSGAKSDGYTLVKDQDYDSIRQLQKILETNISE